MMTFYNQRLWDTKGIVMLNVNFELIESFSVIHFLILLVKLCFIIKALHKYIIWNLKN